MRLSLFRAFFLCNMVLNQAQCNKRTWLLTAEKILLLDCPESWRPKDYSCWDKKDRKNEKSLLSWPSQFLHGIHHCIDLPIISSCRVTESTQNTSLIFFEKIINSRIIIPEIFLLFGSFSMRRKSAYSYFCKINCCIIA